MEWFTSDTHWGHENVLRYDNRPFSSIEEHDEELIRRWNVCVQPGDIVYHLGDVAWHNKQVDVERLLKRLRGTKILICGNHDQKSVVKAEGWAKVTPYHEITIQGQKICLFHYRMTVWNRSHHGSWALHGHSHGTLPVSVTSKTLDVGTMCWSYAPVSFPEIATAMQGKIFVPVDAHGKKTFMGLTTNGREA